MARITSYNVCYTKLLRVVGINTAIFSRSGGYMGVGFAIPSNLAKSIAEQLITSGEVRRGWLGVRIQDLTADLAKSFGLERVVGALVTEVMPDSAADRAGLKRGDILLRFDGREVRGVRDLQLKVASKATGSTVEVVVLRAGKELSLRVTVAARVITSYSIHYTKLYELPGAPVCGMTLSQSPS